MSGLISFCCVLNPNKPNELSHPYHLDESTFTFRGIGCNFSFLFHFSTKIMSAHRIARDGTPRLHVDTEDK